MYVYVSMGSAADDWTRRLLFSTFAAAVVEIAPFHLFLIPSIFLSFFLLYLYIYKVCVTSTSRPLSLSLYLYIYKYLLFGSLCESLSSLQSLTIVVVAIETRSSVLVRMLTSIFGGGGGGCCLDSRCCCCCLLMTFIHLYW
jgi:hypothetical protein